MLNFKEYMIPQPDFKQVMKAVDEAMSKGKYHHAWELVNQARPRSEEESSVKTMYLSELRNKQDEFLKIMKKGQV